MDSLEPTPDDPALYDVTFHANNGSQGGAPIPASEVQAVLDRLTAAELSAYLGASVSIATVSR